MIHAPKVTVVRICNLQRTIFKVAFVLKRGNPAENGNVLTEQRAEKGHETRS